MLARRQAGLKSFAERVCGSAGNLRKTVLVRRQVRNSTSKPFFLLLKTFEFLELIYSNPAILLLRAVIGLVDVTDPPDRIKTGRTVSRQDLNPPQFRHNLLRHQTIVWNSISSFFPIISAD